MLNRLAYILQNFKFLNLVLASSLIYISCRWPYKSLNPEPQGPTVLHSNTPLSCHKGTVADICICRQHESSLSGFKYGSREALVQVPSVFEGQFGKVKNNRNDQNTTRNYLIRPPWGDYRRPSFLAGRAVEKMLILF